MHSSDTIHPIVAQQGLSPQQLAAVLARGQTVLVVAGAGTGKTKTLTARILHLLAQESSWEETAGADARESLSAQSADRDATPLRRIAAVTFTRKAAREMRARLRQQMAAWLRSGEPTALERSRWERLLVDLDAALIGTIHSLCTEILRAHPVEAHLDPTFGVLDEGAGVALVEDSIEAALAWAAGTAQGAELLQALAVEPLRRLVRALIQRRGDAASALDSAAEEALRAEIIAYRTRMRGFLHDAAVQDAMAEIARAVAHSESHPSAASDLLTPFLRETVTCWEGAQTFAADEEWGAVARQLRRILQQRPGMKGRAATWAPLDPKAALADVRSALLEQLPDLETCDPEQDERLLHLLPPLRSLFAQAVRSYDDAKEALHLLDFEDLEARAVALLEGHADVAAEWKARFLALLVDEFQDTNARQRRLIELLSPGPSALTFVGDPKQSIYRFRGASVEVIQRERAALAQGASLAQQANGDNASEAAPGGLPLSTSYRAHDALVGLLNDLLEPVLGVDTGDPVRTPFEPLTPSGMVAARSAGPWVELLLAEGTKKSGALQGAATRLAQRLHELHAQGYAWNEMAILCRGTRSFEPYEDAFEAAAIPYVTVAGRGFYDRPEVRDLLSALKAFVDPSDNTALFGLLRSPAVGLSDPFLFSLGLEALGGKKGPMARGRLWQVVRASNDADALRAATLVAEMNALAGRSTVATLLKAFYERTGYPAALERAGQARGARNLAKLHEDALRTGETSVATFLAGVELLKSGAAREGEARADDDGVVQIMTVHMAKGLQWPVVVIGDAAAQGGRGGRDGLLIADGKIFLNLRSEEANGTPGALGILHTQAAARERAAEEAESDRLLYVAATRAEQMLLFSANVKVSGSGELSGWLGRLQSGLNLAPPLLSLKAKEPRDAPPEQPVRDLLVATNDRMQTLDEAPPLESAVRLLVWRHEGCESAQPGTGPAAVDAAAIEREEPAAEPTAPATMANLPLLAPLPAPRVLEPFRSPWRMVPHADDARALNRAVYDIARTSLMAWRFPAQRDDADFARAMRGQFPAHGISDPAKMEKGTARILRILWRMAVHGLRREVDAATLHLHDLPYDCPRTADFPAEASEAPWLHGEIDLLYRRPADGQLVVVDFRPEHYYTEARQREKLADPTFTRQVRRHAAAVRHLMGEDPTPVICFLDVRGQIVLAELKQLPLFG